MALLPEGKYLATIVNHDITTIGKNENPAAVFHVIVGLGIKKDGGEPHDGGNVERSVAYWLESDGMGRLIEMVGKLGWAPDSLELLGSEHFDSSPLKNKEIQLVVYHKNGNERFFINSLGYGTKTPEEKGAARNDVLSRFSGSFRAEKNAIIARNEAQKQPAPF